MPLSKAPTFGFQLEGVLVQEASMPPYLEGRALVPLVGFRSGCRELSAPLIWVSRTCPQACCQYIGIASCTAKDQSCSGPDCANQST